MKDEQVVAVTALAILGVPALLFFSALLNGYVLSILWKWFISGVFEIRQITISQAAGLSLIINYLTASFSNKQKDEREHPFLQDFVTALAKPLFSLLFGWIITLFM